MIAQGKKMMAIAQLEQLDGNAPAGDLGLAFALAGEHVRAVSLLESAASAAGATGRVRQNLALAYALSGDWQKARTVAAQDVSSADLRRGWKAGPISPTRTMHICRSRPCLA
jgi:Flp pilus assembly protein TadD